MVAPDSTVDETQPASPALPAAATADDPAAEPQWPTRPTWLNNAPSIGLPFLNRPAAPQGGVDALWAESNREVAAQRSAAKPASAVQPCVSCGLSLSATARFCRRCGSAQG
jgi:ribosomal protein L40E